MSEEIYSQESPADALRPVDISRFLHIDASAIRRRMAAGEFGPPFRVGRRLYVRRGEYEAAIDRLESATSAAQGRSSRQTPPAGMKAPQ